MTTTNRAALLNKLHRVLKRTYKPTPPRDEQPLMESLLFACCLENTRCEVAQESFERLKIAFFDWNEIRVSTVKELSEVLSTVSEPAAAATRLKTVLQSVFESDYTFDLEHLKKQNLGAAVKRLQKLSGATPFTIAYATQVALRGHSIPVDKGTLGTLYVLGVVSESEAESGNVPGMERAIPKSKGVEFGAMLHELGADFFTSPHSPALRELLVSIAPDAKDRFPKRTSRKAAVAAVAQPEPAAVDGKKKDKAPPAAAKKQAARGQAKRPVRAPKTAPRPHKKATPKKTAAKALGKRKPR